MVQVEFSRVKSSWLPYSFLLLFRVIVGPFLFGYVHPDEFFQGGQELFFGCPPTIPWEFEPNNALRSVVPPALTTILPLQVYSSLRKVIKEAFGWEEMMVGMGSLSGMEVLVIPRIACSLLSIFTIDRSVWFICNSNSSGKRNKDTSMTGGSVPIPVLLLASSWPTMVMLTRPFSNSVESYILALLMVTVLSIEINEKQEFSSESSVGFAFCCKVGIICALGIFTRFTFVFFACPILLMLLNSMIRSFGLKKGILWRKLGWMALSFVCIALGIVWADTTFYLSRHNGKPMHGSTDDCYEPAASLSMFNSSFILTPFNALSYNSKISNLKDHGLHPRWTHAVVNMVIMYGPLTLATYVLITKTFLHSASATTSNLSLRKPFGEVNATLMASGAVLIFGLGFLSIAPHQEPRFLLPLLIPLVLLGEIPFRRYPTACVVVWVLFNTILLTLFGILHQGGVTQSLLEIGSSQVWGHQKQPTSWIYMNTYMPPTFLTRLSHDVVHNSRTCGNYQENGVCNPISFHVFGAERDDACQKAEVRIMDLKGSSIDKLSDTLQSELSCNTRRQDDSKFNSFLYLVAPKGQCELPNDTYKCSEVKSLGPHLSTEDFPPLNGSVTEFYTMLALSVYKISCAAMT